MARVIQIFLWRKFKELWPVWLYLACYALISYPLMYGEEICAALECDIMSYGWVAFINLIVSLGVAALWLILKEAVIPWIEDNWEASVEQAKQESAR